MAREVTLQPIGVIRTPYREKSDTPRQPGALGESVRARVILEGGRNFEEALKDLEGFERVWILTWFDRSEHWKPKVLPPRSKKKHGVFATRSPHRPNPLGLTLCRLLAIRGRTLVIENPDLLDRTPVLDIKPYLPYADAFPGARTGWLEEESGEREEPYTVQVHRSAADQFEWLREGFGVDLEPRVRTVLSGSPHPHPYRRIKAGPGDHLTFAVRSWRVIFRVEGRTVHVERVLSGYTAGAVANAARAEMHDGRAHAAFHRKWPVQQHE